MRDPNLFFTDTDSLCYSIKTEDAYKDLFEGKELFDNSDYNVDPPFYFDFNKKVIGKMKDETCGVPIKEFIGLRSKMYAIKLGEKTIKKYKGINKNVVKKDVLFNDYKDVLFGKGTKEHTMNSIRSKKLSIGTYNIRKTSLSCYDNKRFIEPDGIGTKSYGRDGMV